MLDGRRRAAVTSTQRGNGDNASSQADTSSSERASSPPRAELQKLEREPNAKLLLPISARHPGPTNNRPIRPQNQTVIDATRLSIDGYDIHSHSKSTPELHESFKDSQAAHQLHSPTPRQPKRPNLPCAPGRVSTDTENTMIYTENPKPSLGKPSAQSRTVQLAAQRASDPSALHVLQNKAHKKAFR